MTGPIAEVTETLHRCVDAIVANDVDAMAHFVTDDWVLVDRPGTVGVADFHGAVRSGRLRHDTMTHEVLDVRFPTPDVAIVLTRARNTGTYEGRQISADEWTSDVFVRSGTGWRCTLTHLTPCT